jgi:hypothetical protein
LRRSVAARSLWPGACKRQLALQSLRVISEKNYRLQDIQLSKIRLPASDFWPRHVRAVAGSPEPAAPNRGGEYRARTGDLLVANQALSQLS